MYFDATIVLAGSQSVNFAYFQYSMVLAFSLFYFFNKGIKVFRLHRKLIIATVVFLLIILLIPILKGQSINETVRIFSVNYASIIILPVAFHYYSQKGNIMNLLRSGYYFILSWVLIVLLFTYFKIDVAGDFLGSGTFGGNIFYFGNMARRGAITYISFALLLVPLILNYTNKAEKTTLIISSGFLLSIMFIALKRFSFVVIILGLINYFIKSSLSLKLKIRVIFGAGAIGILLFILTNIGDITMQSYENRGAEQKFGSDAIERDIRIYEPLYVFSEVRKGSFSQILFGEKENINRIQVDSEMHSDSNRIIHNEYAQMMLKYGIIGLLAYLYILIVIYRITVKLKNELLRKDVEISEYWIVFQNLILIFIVAGMVGGHVHVTFRALVFVFGGGISGYLYKLNKQNKKVY